VANTELLPGSYPIYIKEQFSDSWRFTGEIDLEFGHKYRVEMLEPDGVALTMLD
jgi:hypothetical protein